jgi:thioredoxin 1
MENVTAEYVKQLQLEGKKILVDYWATWCGPCQALIPRLELLESDYPNVTFVKVNVDEERDLAVKYQIRSIPTLVLFKEGVPVWRNSGVLTEQKISDKIKEVL